MEQPVLSMHLIIGLLQRKAAADRAGVENGDAPIITNRLVRLSD